MGPPHPRPVGARGRVPATIAPLTAGVGETSLALAPHLASIGRGRRWVAAEAARHGIGATGLRIVQLLASELIANAVVHGPAGGAVTVRTVRDDDRLRVEVDDADSTTRPRLLSRNRVEDGGHGLMLVDRFADRWGYDLHGADGKTVWFEYLLPSVSGPVRGRGRHGDPARPDPGTRRADGADVSDGADDADDDVDDGPPGPSAG